MRAVRTVKSIIGASETAGRTQVATAAGVLAVVRRVLVWNCGANYPNNVGSWMAYGPFSLSNTTAADLRFKLWLNSEPGSDGVCRFASIDASDFWGTCTSGYATGWVDQALDLANVYTLGNLLGQSNVWVAIYFASNATNAYAEGGYVDNIVLRKCMAGETCRMTVSSMSPGDGQVGESAAHVVIPK